MNVYIIQNCRGEFYTHGRFNIWLHNWTTDLTKAKFYPRVVWAKTAITNFASNGHPYKILFFSLGNSDEYQKDTNIKCISATRRFYDKYGCNPPNLSVHKLKLLQAKSRWVSEFCENYDADTLEYYRSIGKI